MNGRQIPCAVPHNRTFFFYHQVVLSAVIGAFFAYIRWRVVCWFGLRSPWFRLGFAGWFKRFSFSIGCSAKGILAPSSSLIGCKQIDDWLFFFYYQVVVSAVIGAFFAYIGWRVVCGFGLRSPWFRLGFAGWFKRFSFPIGCSAKGILAPSSLLIGCKQIDDWLFFFYHQVVVSVVIRVFFFCNAREQNTPSKRIPRKRPFKFIL